MTLRWTLFVDESGNFNKPSAHVLVAGVCIPARIDAGFSVAFKHYVQKEAPLVPWPPHRTYMQRPSMYVLWYDARPDANLTDALTQALKDAHTLFSARAADAQSRAAEALKSGAEPKWDDVKSLDRVFKEHQPNGYEAVNRYAEDTNAAVASVLRTLLQERLNLTPNDEAQPFAVFSSETMLGDAASADDRYLQLLECLLERLADEFIRRGGEHTVDLNVASRHILDPTTGNIGPLSRTRLGQLSQSGNKNVRLLPNKIWKYDANVDAGLVVADAISNYLFTRTHYASLPGSEIQSLIQDYFSFDANAGSPALPQISASGIARQSVQARELRQGEPGTRVWAMEQASAWIAFFKEEGQ